MSSEPRNHGSPGTNYSSSLLTELKAQCERLQQMVKGLEDEKRRDAEALAAVQAELRQYQRFLYDWAHQQVREEDWQGFREDDYTLAAEEAIAELERLEGP